MTTFTALFDLANSKHKMREVGTMKESKRKLSTILMTAALVLMLTPLGFTQTPDTPNSESGHEVMSLDLALT